MGMVMAMDMAMDMEESKHEIDHVYFYIHKKMMNQYSHSLQDMLCLLKKESINIVYFT